VSVCGCGDDAAVSQDNRDGTNQVGGESVFAAVEAGTALEEVPDNADGCCGPVQCRKPKRGGRGDNVAPYGAGRYDGGLGSGLDTDRCREQGSEHDLVAKRRAGVESVARRPNADAKSTGSSTVQDADDVLSGCGDRSEGGSEIGAEVVTVDSDGVAVLSG
jgi:hypothetical protein